MRSALSPIAIVTGCKYALSVIAAIAASTGRIEEQEMVSDANRYRLAKARIEALAAKANAFPGRGAAQGSLHPPASTAAAQPPAKAPA